MRTLQGFPGRWCTRSARSTTGVATVDGGRAPDTGCRRHRRRDQPQGCSPGEHAAARAGLSPPTSTPPPPSPPVTTTTTTRKQRRGSDKMDAVQMLSADCLDTPSPRSTATQAPAGRRHQLRPRDRALKTTITSRRHAMRLHHRLTLPWRTARVPQSTIVASTVPPTTRGPTAVTKTRYCCYVLPL